MEQDAQRSSGYPIPVSVQDQASQGSDQLDLMDGNPAQGRGGKTGWVLRSLPTQPLCDSMKILLQIHVYALFLLLWFIVCASSGTDFPGYAAEQ